MFRRIYSSFRRSSLGTSFRPQQIGQQIGKGQFATVHKAINLHTGEVVAVKCFDASNLSKNTLADVTVRRQLLLSQEIPRLYYSFRVSTVSIGGRHLTVCGVRPKRIS